MSTLEILLTVYIVSVLVVMVFAVMAHADGLASAAAAFLITAGCIPLVGTFAAVLLLVLSVVYRGRK